jgi:DNA-binding NtrC family response regulator
MLILGGKITRDLGSHHNGEFVAINCACRTNRLNRNCLDISEALFPNAIASRNEYVRQADGVTSFIEEIGETSLHA